MICCYSGVTGLSAGTLDLIWSKYENFCFHFSCILGSAVDCYNVISAYMRGLTMSYLMRRRCAHLEKLAPFLTASKITRTDAYKEVVHVPPVETLHFG